MMQKGFTLMELLIVIAIIGILAVIAVPFAQNYFAKAQATEAFTLTSNLRQEIVLHVAEHGTLDQINATSIPTNAAQLKGKYIAEDGVSVGDGGTITVTFSSGSNKGKSLIIRPQMGTQQIHWTCNASEENAIDANHLPSACERANTATPATSQ